MELFLDNVTKEYRDKTAVSGVTLTITKGIWGMLGANGAGKTTLMRIIAGIMSPTGGQILYDGVPIARLGEGYRAVFGYLPQEFGYYPEFSVRDYLEYMAALKGVPRAQTARRIDGLLERLSLSEVGRKRIKKLSGGMKRRVGIAQALLNEPEILLLDEPTSGLDPGERIRFRNLISEFARERIVIISTHIVPDVEYIATENIIVKDGAVVATGTAERLAGEMAGRVWTIEAEPNELPHFESAVRVINIRNMENGRIELRYLAEHNPFEAASACEPRLEDYYLWMFPEEGGER